MKLFLMLGFIFSPFIAFPQYDTATVVVSQQDWVYAVSSNDNEKTYVKSEYVKKDYSEIKVWIKTKFPSRTFKNKIYKNGEEKQLWLVNCSDKQLQIQQTVLYDFRGKVIDSQKAEQYELEWLDVVPDSVGEAIVNKICELFN